MGVGFQGRDDASIKNATPPRTRQWKSYPQLKTPARDLEQILPTTGKEFTIKQNCHNQTRQQSTGWGWTTYCPGTPSFSQFPCDSQFRKHACSPSSKLSRRRVSHKQLFPARRIAGMSPSALTYAYTKRESEAPAEPSSAGPHAESAREFSQGDGWPVRCACRRFGSAGASPWDDETVVEWGLWEIGLENYYAPTYSLCA
jgi:hypothetical protein